MPTNDNDPHNVSSKEMWHSACVASQWACKVAYFSGCITLLSSLALFFGAYELAGVFLSDMRVAHYVPAVCHFDMPHYTHATCPHNQHSSGVGGGFGASCGTGSVDSRVDFYQGMAATTRWRIVAAGNATRALGGPYNATSACPFYLECIRLDPDCSEHLVVDERCTQGLDAVVRDQGVCDECRTYVAAGSAHPCWVDPDRIDEKHVRFYEIRPWFHFWLTLSTLALCGICFAAGAFQRGWSRKCCVQKLQEARSVIGQAASLL